MIGGAACDTHDGDGGQAFGQVRRFNRFYSTGQADRQKEHLHVRF